MLLKSAVNPEVIGGLLVRIDNFVIDASVMSKINKLKAQFSQNIYRAGF
ncbi:MAG: F0F1 ATP synthase subunit delta [Bacteroidales bacterium]|nr:F0F1 ATP synthase subunit delta [Bacteroidales bacterium]